MYRKLLGYMGANKKYPIYEAMPGALVTQAFIHCCECREAISGTMGPRNNAYCIECTDLKIKSDAKAKLEEEESKKELAKKKALLKQIAEESDTDDGNKSKGDFTQDE